jgi:alcohol dehydrogenase class IV
MSVVLCAPAAVAALAKQHPERHAAVAAALGCAYDSSGHANLAASLKSKLVQLMRNTGMPSGMGRSCMHAYLRSNDYILLSLGLSAAGYSSCDAVLLAGATMMQQRLLNNMPATYERLHIEQVFQEAMDYW